jgi:hypothetical protein
MNWIYLAIGLVALLGLSALVGLVRSILRLVIALVTGLLAALAFSWIVQFLGLTETVPGGLILAAGALGALSVLLKR